MITLSTSLLASALISSALTVTQTPSSLGSVPVGGSRIPMLTLTLQASCAGPATVRSITVHHTGIGATEDIARLYLLEGTTRVSRATTLQRTSGEAILRPTKFTIDACKTRTIQVAMDLSPSAAAGAEHGIALKAAEDVQSNAAVTLTATRAAATVSAAAYNAGSVSYAEVPLATRNVLFGKNRSLLRFSLKAVGTAQSVQAITFTNDGSARDGDLQNLALYTSNGERVSEESVRLDGDTVRIPFVPAFSLERNATHLLTLKGDVTASRRRTIEMRVKEPSDIEAVTLKRSR